MTVTIAVGVIVLIISGIRSCEAQRLDRLSPSNVIRGREMVDGPPPRPQAPYHLEGFLDQLRKVSDRIDYTHDATAAVLQRINVRIPEILPLREKLRGSSEPPEWPTSAEIVPALLQFKQHLASIDHTIKALMVQLQNVQNLDSAASSQDSDSALDDQIGEIRQLASTLSNQLIQHTQINRHMMDAAQRRFDRLQCSPEPSGWDEEELPPPPPEPEHLPNGEIPAEQPQTRETPVIRVSPIASPRSFRGRGRGRGIPTDNTR